MIKVYVMSSCPDCRDVKTQIEGNPEYVLIDIGSHVRCLKEFLRIRDSHPAFRETRAKGLVGIPCYVDEDGNVDFSMDGIETTRHAAEGASCSLDGKGC